MSVTRGREAAFFFSNYRIRVLRFLYGTLLSAYEIYSSQGLQEAARLILGVPSACRPANSITEQNMSYFLTS